MGLRKDIERYQEIFTGFGGLKGGGVTRLLYTDEWLGALNKLKEEMEAIGMTAHFDEVGNLFGVIEGSGEDPKYISTGSHIDTVVEGGNLDGQFGIVAGLTAIKNLVEKKGKPKETLQLIALAEEEGSRFPTVFWGSRNVFGLADSNEVKELVDIEGKNFVDEMRRCGFDFRKTNQPAKVDKFIEIHIEQGNFLEKSGNKIGVITAITGQKRYDVRIFGEANHAGTTRMEYRKDAAYAFAKIVKSSIEMAREVDDIMVITFGRAEFTPNTVNVVPGIVDFSIDCRHPDGKVLDEFTKKIEENMEKIVKELDMKIEINKWMDQEPVPMCEDIMALIEEEAEKSGYKYQLMHSGAGHDSQIFAEHLPTGMIFVPSIGGISHNINEKTDIEDLEIGTKLLEQVLERLAY